MWRSVTCLSGREGPLLGCSSEGLRRPRLPIADRAVLGRSDPPRARGHAGDAGNSVAAGRACPGPRICADGEAAASTRCIRPCTSGQCWHMSHGPPGPRKPAPGPRQRPTQPYTVRPRGVRREGWNAGSGVRVGVEVVDCSPQVGRAQLKSTITTQPAAHQCPWRPMGPRSSQSTFAKALDPSQRMCLGTDTRARDRRSPGKK